MTSSTWTRPTRRSVGPSVLVVLFVLVMLMGCSRPGDAAPTPSVDASVVAARKAAGIPDCTASPVTSSSFDAGALVLPCLGGDVQVPLLALSRGRPMVVNFWAQWCKPCRAEAPHLAATQQALDGKVQFVGIDYVDSYPDVAVAFARDAGWRYPQLADPHGLTRQPPWQVGGIPQTLLISADGRIVHRMPGQVADNAELLAAIEQYLKVTR